MSLRDYWRIIRRRKWIIGAVTIIFGVASVLLGEITRPAPVFQATANVRVERVTTGANFLAELLTVSAGDNLATQAAIIRGFPVLERAAKLLKRIPEDVPSEKIRNDPEYQKIVKRLQGQVRAEQEANTNILKITATSGDKTEVAKVANAVAEAYRNESISTRNQQVVKAKEFIETRRKEVGDRLREAEEQLRSLKEQRGFISLNDETTNALARVAALEAEYDRARRARDEVAGFLRHLQDNRAAAARIAPDPSDTGLAKLAAALTDLQTQRENLLLTFTPRHPQAQELDAQIENLRDSLRQELEARLRTLTARAGDLEARVRQARAQNQALPEVALEMARVQREVKLNEELFTQLETKYQEVQIREREKIEEVHIELPATEPADAANRPDFGTKFLAGILVGLLLGLVLAFTVESLDTSIGTIEDVENFLSVPVMGLIPDIGPDDLVIAGAPDGRQEAQPFLITLQNPSSPIAEAYRSLRTNLDFVALERQVKTLVITSASRTEGKSTTAVNLAIAMAQMGRKTLLVETDLRKPFLHFAFGIPKEPGLAEAILGNQPWTAVVRTVTDLMLGRLGLDQIVGAPNIDKLHLITSGTPPSNPAEFLNSQRMTELIAAFREQFDIVIFDCAPVLPVTDAAILASKTDGTLLVHRVGTIARAALRRSKTLLENVHGRVLGIVLTGLKAEISPDFEELEYYRYGYGEKAEGVERGGAPGARTARAPKRRWLPSLFSSKIFLVVAGAAAAAAVGAWYGAESLRAAAAPPGSQATYRHPDQAAPQADASPAAGPAATGGEARPFAAPEATGTPCPNSAPPMVSGARRDGVAPAVVLATSDVFSGWPSAAVSEEPADSSAPGAAQEHPAPPGRSPSGGMSLQVAAFREADRARSYVESLRRDGLMAFSVPVEVPGKGRWLRVYVGPFSSEAAAARRRLPADRTARAKAHHLPYSLESAPLRSYEEAAVVVARVRDLGYAPSVVADGGLAGPSQFRVIVDAFATPGEAQMAAQQLQTTRAGFRGVLR